MNIICWTTLSAIKIKNENKNVLADISTFVANLIQKIGLPINNFFIWNDDVEYSLRMSKLTKILQVKDAVVEHCGTQRTSSLVSLWKTYYSFRNRFVLRKKYSKNKPIAYLYITLLLFINSLAVLTKASYKSKRILYINGYFNAYFDALFNKLGKKPKYLPVKNIKR